MFTARKIEAYRRLHAEIAGGDLTIRTQGDGGNRTGENAGRFTAASIDRLPAGKDDQPNFQHALDELIDRLSWPWSVFAARIQAEFDAAAGDELSFAAALLRLKSESIVEAEQIAPVPCAHDPIAELDQIELHLVELAHAWKAYNAAAELDARREAAEWVHDCLRRAATPQMCAGLRPAFAWVLDRSCPSKRGRRATALGRVMFGASIFKDARGQPCTSMAEAAVAQEVTAESIDDNARKIPRASEFPFYPGAGS